MTEEQDPILEKAKQLRAAGASIEEVKQYLQSKGYETGAPEVPLRIANPSRQLQRTRPDATTALQRERQNASGDFEATAPAVAANIASATQVIPGMEAIQAYASSKANDLPYREALETQRGETDAIPAPIKIAGQMAVGAPFMAAPFIPKSPALTGALLGGTDQVLAADPDRDLLDRAWRGAAGAAVGGSVGAALDAVITKGRSVLAPSSSKVIQTLKGERKAATEPLYDAARNVGALPTSPMGTPVSAFLAKPEVAEIVKDLQKLDQFSGMAPDDPRMIDAIYKALSDNQRTVGKAMAVANPSKLNVGRYREQDIAGKKDALLNAIDPVMPTYRPAVEAYAKHSGEIEAVRQGQDALRTGISKGVTTGRNLDRTSFEAFEDAMQKATPAQRERALQGLLGGVKQAATSTSPLRSAGTLLKAPAYMRATQSPSQRAFDELIKAALLGGTTTNPLQ